MSRFTIPIIKEGFTAKDPQIPELFDVYGVDQLYRLKRFNRGEFLVYAGVQAPKWLPPSATEALVTAEGWTEEQAERLTRIKRWADLTVAGEDPNGEYRYIYIQQEGSKLLWKEMVITNELACSINLPGAYDYPKYKPVPEHSGAYTIGFDGAHNYLSWDILSLRKDADTIKEMFEGSTISLWDLPMFPIQYETWEPRRAYRLHIPGVAEPQFVGWLLKEMYKNGVGAPGKFEGLTWVSEEEPSGEWDTRQEIPIPSRNLVASEEEVIVSFGGLPQIAKKGAVVTPSGSDAKLDLILEGIEYLKGLVNSTIKGMKRMGVPI